MALTHRSSQRKVSQGTCHKYFIKHNTDHTKGVYLFIILIVCNIRAEFQYEFPGFQFSNKNIRDIKLVKIFPNMIAKVS